MCIPGAGMIPYVQHWHCRSPPDRAVWGQSCTGKCCTSKLRKITAKYLKIPLGGFGSDVVPVSVILLGLDLAA